MQNTGRSAGEAGWRVSRYNISAPVPGAEKMIIANLFRMTCGVYTPAELYLLDELDELDEGHPILKRFAERGLIVNFDECTALESMARVACSDGHTVTLCICPTMACNFDCPYCFETHSPGRMDRQTREDVVRLAGRMVDAAGAKHLEIVWFGGEPLLAAEIIEDLSGQLMQLADSRGIRYSAFIVTNGYLLTQPLADLLGRCGVEEAQITLDGIGAVHDATRHLAGGGGTFDRITGNLRDLKLPFKVKIRHNVHGENRGQIREMKELAETLSRESGNRITCYAADVSGNDASDSRGADIQLLCGGEVAELQLPRDAEAFTGKPGMYCAASRHYYVNIDTDGRLYKCMEEVDKPDHHFGSAATWDPADPVMTADHPENMIRFLNTALPNGDEECRDCVWLPVCAGGCPNQRLFYRRQCLPYKDDPEKYVLALYARMRQKKQPVSSPDGKDPSLCSG